MVSSTTSAVDPESPSIFEYFERDGAIWGGYEGDTVTFGKFVGTRTGDTIWVSFVHVLKADGTAFDGLYAAGEAAGFGGGGVHGYRSLEGTFLGGCVFSGRAAGRAAVRDNG